MDSLTTKSRNNNPSNKEKQQEQHLKALYRNKDSELSDSTYQYPHDDAESKTNGVTAAASSI
ncbi:hypothetical protein MTR_1g060540 [Medicago truncatula]|uniref:Uncharacterized protein n=1 Tax=Medicago truncatula TaxID=3880 RepID=A0A072VVC9_MEDTR|nr:hypothetical protein MTR_1g060540 [Medicago truncatula]